MVDDAHASGVLAQVSQRLDRPFRCHVMWCPGGTLFKAIGALAVTFGIGDLIDYLYHRARAFFFLDFLTPIGGGELYRGFRDIGQEPERSERLWRTRVLQTADDAGWGRRWGRSTPASETRSRRSSSATAGQP